MAINLHAAQKSIRKLLYNTDQYIIPEFQRIYSWEYDQCYQLYSDLVAAMSTKDDYFIGNIILARSDDNPYTPEVIDGQQRLVTIWILLCVLDKLVESVDLETTVLQVKAWKKNEENKLKIESHVLEDIDKDKLITILSYSKQILSQRYLESLDKNFSVCEALTNSRIEYISLLFYGWLSQNSISETELEDFTDFILDHVYLLPIELGGDNIDEAKDKALKIFETINNRGLNLQDADIFKARLYIKAIAKHEEVSFSQKWQELIERSSNLKITTDEIFRIYSHIIRGKHGIVTSEKKLREFYLNDKISPLMSMEYNELMDQLFLIIEILENLNELSKGNDQIASWLQVLDFYTNGYPKYAVCAYLYKNSSYDKLDFIDFLKTVSRYSYYTGSTTSVKFGIYVIIQRIMENISIDGFVYPNIKFSNLSTSSRLLAGYYLICYYSENNEFISTPNISKIVFSSELDNIKGNVCFKGIDNSVINTLGNLIITKKSLKKIVPSSRLAEISKLSSNQSFMCSQLFTKEIYLKRQKRLEDILVKFFTL